MSLPLLLNTVPSYISVLMYSYHNPYLTPPFPSLPCPPLFFFFCLQHWLTELEIFAMIFAAAVHDYEHTGTTNNFHIQTR